MKLNFIQLLWNKKQFKSKEFKDEKSKNRQGKAVFRVKVIVHQVYSLNKKKSKKYKYCID